MKRFRVPKPKRPKMPRGMKGKMPKPPKPEKMFGRQPKPRGVPSPWE